MCVACVCVNVCFYSYVLISIFTDLCDTFTYTHTSRKMRVCARRKAVAFHFTNTQTHPHTLSLVNGIKQLSDNSPDGQTRNQASIRLPASSSPYPFNHSISLTHTHGHLPHTWNYNYIFHFATAAKQLLRRQFPRHFKSNQQELLDRRAQQNPFKNQLAQTGHH